VPWCRRRKDSRRFRRTPGIRGRDSPTAWHSGGFHHVFFERPLSRIHLTSGQYTSGKVTVTARVKGRPTTRKVQFVYATTSEPNFLRSRFFRDTPMENYVRAKWKSVAMTESDNGWAATFSLPEPLPRFVAGFVDVEDEIDRRTGYVSSQMLWLKAKERG